MDKRTTRDGAALMADQNNPVIWGWVRYRRTLWKDNQRRRLYEVVLRADHDPFHYTDTTIQFWAKRPRVALRSICAPPRSPKELMALHHTIIN